MLRENAPPAPLQFVVREEAGAGARNAVVMQRRAEGNSAKPWFSVRGLLAAGKGGGERRDLRLLPLVGRLAGGVPLWQDDTY